MDVKESELSKSVIKKVDEKAKSIGFDQDKCETSIKYDPNTNLYCKYYSYESPIGKQTCWIDFDKYGLNIKSPVTSK
jgi:hypothetical protein